MVTVPRLSAFFFFFFNDTATTEIYTFPYTTLFRSHEFERNRHRFGAAQGRASLDTSPVDAPFPGRQADRAAGLSVKQAVPLDVVKDRARCRPADRVVPGRTARLEHDPLSLWRKTGTPPENDEYKDGERKKACLAVNVAGHMLENV